MSRAELAEAVNAWLWQMTRRVYAIDANHVGKLERGENRWPRQHYRDALRVVLRVSNDAALGFYPVRATPTSRPNSVEALGDNRREDHPAEPGRQPDHATGRQPDHATGRQPDHATGRQPDHATGRRQAMKLIAAMASAAVIAPAELEVVSVLGDPRSEASDDRAVLAGHEMISDRLAGMYRSANPLPVLPLAAGYADHLAKHLDSATITAATAARLAPIVVGVHTQVGLWACHADQPSLARRYLAVSVEIAAAADDPALHAQAMGALSYLHSSAPRGGAGGNPRRALQLLDQALAAATMADSFTRGWLATWRADQHATLGHLDQAARDVDFATTALGQAEDGGISGFFARRSYGYGMLGHLDSVRATVQALKGQTQQAERTFAAVHASAANTRRRIATLGHQALVHTVLAEPEAACEMLTQSATWAIAERYGMGLRRVRGIRSTFRPEWSTLPVVVDLDDRLAGTTVA